VAKLIIWAVNGNYKFSLTEVNNCPMIYDGNLKDQKVAQKPGLKEQALINH